MTNGDGDSDGDKTYDPLEAYFDASMTSPDDYVKPAPPRDDATGEDDFDTFDPDDIDNLDAFKKQETRLYRRALEIYEDLLESPIEKTRKDAAKEVVNLYNKAQTSGQGTGNNLLVIGNDAIREALARGARGFEGGYNVTNGRTFEVARHELDPRSRMDPSRPPTGNET